MDVPMCYTHPPRVCLARCVSIVGDPNKHIHLGSVTEEFVPVFDKFGDGFGITDFEDNSWPRFS